MTQSFRQFLPLSLLAGLALLLLSCGGSTSSENCGLIGLTVTPATGSADHTALPPGNQVQFGVAPKVPQGCVINFAPMLAIATWTTSDPTDVSVGKPNAYGVATCVNSTAQVATVTATLGDGTSGSATLSCK